MTSVESHLLALTDASKLPGSQYIVVTSAGVLFEHTCGWADIPRRIPVDAATTMRVNSMSKTIIAVAVLHLVETGRVGLDEPVEMHIGSLQPYGPAVTIRQLISHVR
jgi:D-alanyl-D-alanine carboxypeptidase